MRTVAILVARDPGEGFIGSKYLAQVRGMPMIETVVHDASAWPVDEVVVVLGGDAEEILAGADLGASTVIIDPGWSEGMASSLRVAVDLLLRGPAVDRVVVGLADQPGVDAETVASLVGAPGAAVIPKYRYRRGWPIVLSASLFDLLLGLEGDPDLHDILESHTGAVAEVWVDRLEPARIVGPDDVPPARTGSGDARARGDG
jgi:molybdenum cofactor cytidylyltransferase